ncbi:phosphomevalonate kinase [Tulasnella sp. 403]|nr:phosphomevalonate kinase [Tulasnella sp. 403]
MSSTTVSAPGKVLLAGGYLVLDPKYSGLVVSTSSRFYTIIRDSTNGVSHQITVRSPQFLGASWSYDVFFTHRNEVGLRPSVGNLTKNKFIQLAIERVLFIAIEVRGSQNLRQATAQGLDIIIVGDNDFYSQRGQLAALNLPSAIASLAQIPRFAETNCALADVHKTGLGSSAALITSFICALLLHFALIDPASLDSDKSDGKTLLHNTAQYVHCLAQGKVGSGFDVSSATYGSQTYKRFDPEVIQPLMSDDVPKKLYPYLAPSNADWKQNVQPFRLPPMTRLMLADVDAGTDTPAAVGRVLSWKKSAPEKALQVWDSLASSNDAFAKALTALSALHQRSPGAYQTAVRRLIGHPPNKVIRSKMREMGSLSNVPIEPPEQTNLLDSCVAKPGVIGGGVPGAGGYDAIWVLVLDLPNGPQSSPVTHVESVWSNWKEMNVSPLSCGESHEQGVRLEGPEVLTWLEEAKYL